ncbi:tRNA 2-thiouridine(34) synthase MnmA [Candidatus Dependentiae bacterium]
MKIAVLTSGGVDSSVALALLKDQGHDVTAFYLKIWLEDELSHLGDCPWQEDLDFVTKLCSQCDVPLEVVSLQSEYRDQVVSYALDEVKQGRTPNPDIFCNLRVKFGVFYDKIGEDFEKVASGHYAQVCESAEGVQLLRAQDKIKDQTYFLSHLRQDQLKRAMFPIGHLTKIQVRKIASEKGIPAQDRDESQGICFLGKIKFSEFLKHHLGEKPGDLVEFETGKVLGEHKGFWFHTVGQRKGIGLSGGPWYVVKKDALNNIVFISKNYFDKEKSRNKFYITNFHWISGKPPQRRELKVKLRHGPHEYGCKLDILDDATGLVTLDGRDQGIAPGQFAVFYDCNICLGCAMIRGVGL